MADEVLQEEEENIKETEVEDTEQEALKEEDDEFFPPSYPIPSGAGEGALNLFIFSSFFLLGE